ncbi:MAG: threonine--tRNA ligase [Spirochaetales bacterium]|nr:threonine--tRNA ligase [Spirochaetales bacterium]|tara:strand:- start:3324 stop:5231 length:1908 start_codon:yes stop_codon:yes gene_type:complete
MKVDIKGNTSEFADDINVGEILCKLEYDSSVIGALVDGELRDITYQPHKNVKLEPVHQNSKEGLDLIRHTAAHVLAEAVQSVYPGTKVTIGPVIENGFYYDFSSERNFTEEDLEVFEKKMQEIINQKKPMLKKLVSRQDAIATFKNMGETFKEEIIRDLDGDEEISLYYQGDWFDLCRGPHAPNTSHVKAFKLLSVAGSYWRGDEERESLQRIYGTAFFNKKDLKKYLLMLEEAKKRDHRKLGKELNLFSITDDIGPGLVLWHPNGAIVRSIIENYWRDKHIEADYKIVYTPHVAKSTIWETSGHSEFYKENMFSEMEIDKNRYQTKPMNCPFHIMIYKSELRSYRDLPVKFAEIGTVYRYERSGVLHGLFRARGFTQDDAHIFCTLEQIESEVSRVVDLTVGFLKAFGFSDYEIFVSTRPEKFVGSEDDWVKATDALKSALNNKGLGFSIDDGGGAFYGPKIDLKINDVIGRSWQCSTVQVDFNLPKRFDLNYISRNNDRLQPVMIHRAIFGSFERFFGILVEHYAGAFPFWLAPVQAKILTVSEEQFDYADSLKKSLSKIKLRVEVDKRNEKLGLKIREAEISKTPYILTIGKSEMENETVSVRQYGGKQIGEIKLKDFISMTKKDIPKEDGL